MIHLHFGKPKTEMRLVTNGAYQLRDASGLYTPIVQQLVVARWFGVSWLNWKGGRFIGTMRVTVEAQK